MRIHDWSGPHDSFASVRDSLTQSARSELSSNEKQRSTFACRCAKFIVLEFGGTSLRANLLAICLVIYVVFILIYISNV